MMVREPQHLSRVIQLGNMSYHIVVVNFHGDSFCIIIVSHYLPMLILLLCLFRSHLAGSQWQERDKLGDLLGEKVPERDVRKGVSNHIMFILGKNN